jgi:hypothetical protein
MIVSYMTQAQKDAVSCEKGCLVGGSNVLVHDNGRSLRSHLEATAALHTSRLSWDAMRQF